MKDHRESTPVHPGRILLERVMRPLGISRNQLARDIDVPVGRISDITNGKRGITADTAMRLGRYFGIPPQLWMRLQAEFDLHQLRTTTWNDIESRVRILDGAKTSPGPRLAGDAPSPERESPPAQPAPANSDLTLPEPQEPAETGDSVGIPSFPADDRT
jgi:addiction module HigA family antidote